MENDQDHGPNSPTVSDDADAPEASGAGAEPFDAPVRSSPDAVDVDSLIVNLDGYAGPLDVLLELARTQKVDLKSLSIAALVDQYLAFVEEAKARRLELAADYLVMASWLAFLKSKLLLPQPKDEGQEPTADEMAAQLAFQLQRLEAMRRAADALFELPRLGLERHPRGAPEGVRVKRTPDWQADLFDLLKAYATQRVAAVERTYAPEKPIVLQIEEARARLARILGDIPDWIDLGALTPKVGSDAPAPSIMASAFNAALEFAKDGRIDLRQAGHFQPIYIKRKSAGIEAARPPTVIAAE